MTDERKRDDARDQTVEADRQKAKDQPKLAEKKPKLGDTVEGEGSPGLSIGGGHA